MMIDEPGPLSEEELLERLQEEMRKITVPDYLAHLLVSLSSMAFQRLGLTPDTLADRDLSQSRMAIDAFEALTKVLSAKLGEQDAAMYRSTVHQMRMAYLRAADGGTEEVDTTTDAAGADEDPGQSDAAGANEYEAGTPTGEKE